MLDTQGDLERLRLRVNVKEILCNLELQVCRVSWFQILTFDNPNSAERVVG